MRYEDLIEVDWFNYYSIKFLEVVGKFSPNQCEIDAVECLLREVVEILGTIGVSKLTGVISRSRTHKDFLKDSKRFFSRKSQD